MSALRSGTGCKACAGRFGHVVQDENEVARLARRCARDDTPRNRAALAKAIAQRDRAREIYAAQVCTH